MNVHVLYVLQEKSGKKIVVCLSVCVSVRLDVWLYVRTWILAVATITFEGVNGFKQNLVGVMKCRFEIQTEIMILILILNKILILTKTLRNDTKFGGHV